MITHIGKPSLTVGLLLLLHCSPVDKVNTNCCRSIPCHIFLCACHVVSRM